MQLAKTKLQIASETDRLITFLKLGAEDTATDCEKFGLPGSLLPGGDVELDGVAMDVDHPFIHGEIHLLGGFNEIHEINRLGAAAKANRQFIFPRYRHGRGRDGIRRDPHPERWNAAPFHPNKRWMIYNGRG